MINQYIALPRLDLRGVLALTGAAACWGVATVMTKALLYTFPPLTLLTIQLSASIVLLWTFVFATAQTIPRYRQLIAVGLLGLLNPGISYALSLLGLRLTTASMSTLLWASEPVLIIGLAWLFLHERLPLKDILLMALAVGGVMLISLSGQQLTSGGAIGNLLILGGVFCCALYTVLARDSHHTTNPLVAVALQQTFAFLMAVAILPLEIGRNPVAVLSHIDGATWIWAPVTGIIYYALAFWFYLQGLARTRVTVAGIFINLIPLFGISAAYFILGERLVTTQWIGTMTILLVVFCLLGQQDRREA